MEDIPSVEGEVETLSEKIQSILDNSKPYLRRLAVVWSELGLCETQRQPRRDEFEKHLLKEHTELLAAMADEEEKMKMKVIADVNEYKLELDNLCNEMKRSIDMPAEELPLVAKVKHFKSKVDALRTEKHERMKRLKRLAEMEVALCEILGGKMVIVPFYKSKELPTEEKLKEFLDIIEKMEARKATSQTTFFAFREKIAELWTQLDLQPCDERQQSILDGDIKKFALCQENMDYLPVLQQELEKEFSQLEFKAAALREKVTSLWTRLAVPVEERNEFNQVHVGSHIRTIKALEKETERLELLKKQNLKRFIQATRTELEKVWNKCHYGEQQKREFSPAFTDDYSDDSLGAHESELDKIKGFYEDHKDIFKLIDKREEMWIKMLNFEANASNPSRFENRGGKLLKEEKARKAIEKELPKVEKELESNLLQWENDWERHFIVNDTRYLDIVSGQRNERDRKKNDEIQKRQKIRKETTMAEMFYGSKPATPVKRKFAGAVSSSCLASPRNSPLSKKLKKVPPSPLVQSTMQTRGKGKGLKRRLSKGKKRTSVMQRNASRRILSSKNSIIPEESYTSQGFESSIASTGNYSQFQKGLHQGISDSRNARSSSVLHNNVSTLSCLSAGTK